MKKMLTGKRLEKVVEATCGVLFHGAALGQERVDVSDTVAMASPLKT